MTLQSANTGASTLISYTSRPLSSPTLPPHRPCAVSHGKAHPWAREIRAEDVDAPAFWARVDVRGPDECWPWTGRVRGRMGGEMRVAGRMRLAGRVAYALEYGALHAREALARMCGVVDCVNPRHARIRPLGDNIDHAKGRAAAAAARRLRTERREVCSHGHPMYTTRQGRRRCRECHRRHAREHRARVAAARRAS